MKWRSGDFLQEYKFFGQKTCIFFFFFLSNFGALINKTIN